MLRKLEIKSDSHKDTKIAIRDEDVACNIVSHIFGSVDMCLREDKSKVKLSLFAKSFIRGIMSDNVKNGINDFIRNMRPNDVNLLLDQIDMELKKRR